MIEIKLIPPEDKTKIKVTGDIRTVKDSGDKLPQYYFVPLFPQVPGWLNKNLVCQGFTVNLFKFTCTCPAYNAGEKNYKGRDVRLACKHIYYKVLNYKDRLELPQILLLLLKNAVISHAQYFYKFKFREHVFYYSFNEKSVWVNVYAHALGDLKNNYVAYAYNPITNRWAGNSFAQPEFEIVEILRKIIKRQLLFTPIFAGILK